jgi:hypothetical protein
MPKQIIQRADSILQSVTHCDALNTISDLDNPEVLCGKIKIFPESDSRDVNEQWEP